MSGCALAEGVRSYAGAIGHESGDLLTAVATGKERVVRLPESCLIMIGVAVEDDPSLSDLAVGGSAAAFCKSQLEVLIAEGRIIVAEAPEA